MSNFYEVNLKTSYFNNIIMETNSGSLNVIRESLLGKIFEKFNTEYSNLKTFTKKDVSSSNEWHSDEVEVQTNIVSEDKNIVTNPVLTSLQFIEVYEREQSSKDAASFISWVIEACSYQLIKVGDVGTAQSPRSGIKSIYFVLTLIMSVFTPAFCEVELNPSHPIYFAGKDAIFTCRVEGATHVRWFINGTLQNTSGTTFSRIIGVGFLNIYQISPSFNNTFIYCEAVYSNSEMSRSRASFVLIQGVPEPVSNISIHKGQANIYISWIPPFTLDVLNYDIHLFYCINVTLYKPVRIISQCDIARSSYVWENITGNIACSRYSIAVVAENPVGSSSVTSIHYEGIENYIIEHIRLLSQSRNETKLGMILNEDICPNSQIYIDSKPHTFRSMSPKELVVHLETYKHYHNLSLLLHFDTVNTLLYYLKTYAVEDTTIFSTTNNSISLHTTFVEGSNASGVLYALMFMSEGRVVFSKSMYFIERKESAESSVIKTVLPGHYIELSYDIDSDGHIQYTGLPSTSDSVFVRGYTNLDSENTKSKNCVINIIFSMVEVKCNCEAAYYQVILQKYNGSMESVMNIQSQREMCSKSVFFHVEQSMTYCVVVFEDYIDNGIFASEVYFSEEFEVFDSHISESYSDVSTIVLFHENKDANHLIYIFSLLAVAASVLFFGIIIIVVYIYKLQLLRFFRFTVQTKSTRDLQWSSVKTI